MKKPFKKQQNYLKEYKKAINSMDYNEFEEMYDSYEEIKEEKENKGKEK